MSGVAPLLVFTWGNPSRGDDALGPLFAQAAGERLAAEIAAGELEILTDFQLQVEHALDLAGRSRVVFVDASVAAKPPFECLPLAAAADPSVTSHSLSPAALLHLAGGLVGEPLPPAWLLAIRGYRFELGEAPTGEAARHLEAALQHFIREFVGGRP